MISSCFVVFPLFLDKLLFRAVGFLFSLGFGLRRITFCTLLLAQALQHGILGFWKFEIQVGSEAATSDTDSRLGHLSILIIRPKTHTHQHPSSHAIQSPNLI